MNARTLAAALIGVALEWYDFIVFGFLASVLGRLFFPVAPRIGLLLAITTFGVGFVMRPLGAVLLGVYADRVGRRRALTLGMLGMAAGTLLVAVAPTYAQIGLAAPMILVLGRLLQGFFTAGEYGGSTAYLIELAPPGQRGFYASLQQSSQFLAAAMGAVSGLLVTGLLSADQLAAWGWRLPFLAGVLVGPLGLWLRAHAPETPEFLHLRRQQRRQPVLAHGRAVLAGFLMTIFATTIVYVLVLYMPIFAIRTLHLPLPQALAASAGMTLLMALLCPLAGAASDRMPRPALPLVALVLTLLVVWPMLQWLRGNPAIGGFWLALAIFAVPIAIVTGILPTLLAESLPAEARATGVSVAYNFAVALFGGFAPALVALLAGLVGDISAVSLYIALAAIPGLAGLLLLPPPLSPPLSHGLAEEHG